MLLTLKAGNALEVANVLVEQLPQSMSDTARKLYKALCWASVEVAHDREYSPNVTHVSWFAPAEAVALAVGIHPTTLYRRLPELREAGLVAVRGHFCTLNGRTRSDGSVWTVRLSPTWGSAARVPYDYLKKQHRSLGADIDAGKTAWAMMQESKATRDKATIDITYILRFALATDSKKPVTYDSSTAQRPDLERIFDVPHTPRQERADAVYQAALAIGSALGDADSTRFYCAVLWSLLRMRDRGEGDFFERLYMMVQRARVDREEGFARSAGSLLTSRLKRAGFWSAVRHGPPVEPIPA